MSSFFFLTSHISLDYFSENDKDILMDEEVNIIDYFRIIKKWWLVIAIIFFVSVLTTFIISIRMPKLYEATATVLSQEVLTEKGVLLTSKLPYILREEVDLYSGGGPPQLIIALLKSGRMAEDAIERFSLEKLYSSSHKSEIIEKVKKRVTTLISKEGVISLRVESHDPKLSADIANFYIENLDKLNQELEISSLKPLVKVLDRAIPPSSPSKPKIKLNLLISGILSIFIGILLSFFLNYVQEEKSKSLKV